jgi:lysophospholipase L1-like esterase
VTGFVSLTPHPPWIYAVHPDPDIGYALKPNTREKAYRATVTTNSVGLRGSEVDPAKPTAAVLGDSIAFGYGVEDGETLPMRLQERMDGWNVVNGAAPGYTLGQEAALYQDRIAKLDPKILILVFYWNDLDDQRPPVLDRLGILRGPDWRESDEPQKSWMERNSAIYVAVQKFLSARREGANLAKQKEEYKANMFQDDVVQEKLDAYDAVLDRFARSLPPALQKLFVIWPEKHVHYLARPKIIAMAEKRGFKTLDLYQIFGNDPESLSWDTVHPSAKTIDEAAGVIAAALEYHGFLPLPAPAHP